MQLTENDLIQRCDLDFRVALGFRLQGCVRHNRLPASQLRSADGWDRASTSDHWLSSGCFSFYMTCCSPFVNLAEGMPQGTTTWNYPPSRSAAPIQTPSTGHFAPLVVTGDALVCVIGLHVMVSGWCQNLKKNITVESNNYSSQNKTRGRRDVTWRRSYTQKVKNKAFLNQRYETT